MILIVPNLKAKQAINSLNQLEGYMFLLQGEVLIRNDTVALTSVPQWVRHHPTKQKVAGLIPGHGTFLGCRPSPWSGRIQEVTN